MNHQPGYWPCWACAEYYRSAKQAPGICDGCQKRTPQNGCNYKTHFRFATRHQIQSWLVQNPGRLTSIIQRTCSEVTSELQLMTLAMHYESTTNEEEKQQ